MHIDKHDDIQLSLSIAQERLKETCIGQSLAVNAVAMEWHRLCWSSDLVHCRPLPA